MPPALYVKVAARIKAEIGKPPEPIKPMLTNRALQCLQHRILQGQSITKEELPGVQRLLHGYRFLNRAVRELTLIDGPVGAQARAEFIDRVCDDICHVHKSKWARQIAPHYDRFPVLASPRLGSVKSVHRQLNELKLGAAIGPGFVVSAKRKNDPFNRVAEACVEWLRCGGIDVHNVGLEEWKKEVRPWLRDRLLPALIEDEGLYEKFRPLIEGEKDLGHPGRIRARIKERIFSRTAALLGLKGQS